MEVFFLAADRPIVKQYRLTDRKKLKKESYPQVYNFTSFSYQINTLDEFFTCITQFSEAGHCLLKGTLHRPLKNESRAGSTSPETLTQWICLDFDGITGYKTVDKALEAMGCGNTDYILQWSASYGVESSQEELNCHVFIMLEEPAHPTLLKNWLKHLNLSTSQLTLGISLTKSVNSLIWPLDITTCQNDKLIYIAPPILGDGVSNPMLLAGMSRLSKIKKKFRRLEIDLNSIPTFSLVETLELQALNKCREANGLKPRKSQKYSSDMDISYLESPDPVQVTGIKTEREFVYFNFNGGDSWGYFHPVSNPAFIFNFKGEPVYRTQDLLPAYWNDIKTRVQNLEPDSAGSVYLAFRDFETATYWNGVYNATSNSIVKFAQAKSESQLRHFMKQHGQPIGDFIPDWDMQFNPKASYVLDQKHKRLNIYKPSLYFARKPNTQDKVPPTIAKVIYHALGSKNDVYERFLNWLAVIVQTLSMTQTAWVVHGTQGTGKGLLFNHVLTPLFGHQNVTSRRMEELGSDFTEFMKNKFIVFIDEVSAGNSLFHERITAKLKNLIVEPRISVREMYKPSTVMDNFTNLIFASNSPRPISIAPDDRRFNVAHYQEKPIKVTTLDIDNLAEEIGDFYDYLNTRVADANIARTPIFTEAKRNIINLSRPSIDIAIEALKQGNFGFFEDMLVDQEDALSPKGQIAHIQYHTLIDELRITQRTKLAREELLIIFRWCVESIPETPNKFAMLLRHHNLHLDSMWINGKTTRGYDVKLWT